MACYSSSVTDIEEFYGGPNDHIKDDIKNNLKQYKEICKNLIEFINCNINVKDLKKRFQKHH